MVSTTPVSVNQKSIRGLELKIRNVGEEDVEIGHLGFAFGSGYRIDSDDEGEKPGAISSITVEAGDVLYALSTGSGTEIRVIET